MKTDGNQRTVCDIPCHRTEYEPTLSYSQLSKFNIERVALRGHPAKRRQKIEKKFFKARETNQRVVPSIISSDTKAMSHLIAATGILSEFLNKSIEGAKTSDRLAAKYNVTNLLDKGYHALTTDFKKTTIDAIWNERYTTPAANLTKTVITPSLRYRAVFDRFAVALGMTSTSSSHEGFLHMIKTCRRHLVNQFLSDELQSATYSLPVVTTPAPGSSDSQNFMSQSSQTTPSQPTDILGDTTSLAPLGNLQPITLATPQTFDTCLYAYWQSYKTMLAIVDVQPNQGSGSAPAESLWNLFELEDAYSSLVSSLYDSAPVSLSDFSNGDQDCRTFITHLNGTVLPTVANLLVLAEEMFDMDDIDNVISAATAISRDFLLARLNGGWASLRSGFDSCMWISKYAVVEKAVADIVADATASTFNGVQTGKKIAGVAYDDMAFELQALGKIFKKDLEPVIGWLESYLAVDMNKTTLATKVLSYKMDSAMSSYAQHYSLYDDAVSSLGFDITALTNAFHKWVDFAGQAVPIYTEEVIHQTETWKALVNDSNNVAIDAIALRYNDDAPGTLLNISDIAFDPFLTYLLETLPYEVAGISNEFIDSLAVVKAELNAYLSGNTMDETFYKSVN